MRKHLAITYAFKCGLGYVMACIKQRYTLSSRCGGAGGGCYLYKQISYTIDDLSIQIEINAYLKKISEISSGTKSLWPVSWERANIPSKNRCTKSLH